MPRHQHQPFRRNAKKDGPKTSWENVSDWYGDYLSKPHTLQQDLVFPGAARLLRPEGGKRYLDIACGQGAFIQTLLQTQPRARYDGIDASPSLIKQAQRLVGQRSARGQIPAVNFRVADARHFGQTLPAQSYDGASCILALQNIDPLTDVFNSAARVLKPGGSLVIVLNHPAFRQPRQSGWGWDEERKLQYRRVDRYLSSYEMPIQAHPGSAPQIKTYSYHRPLEIYIQELVMAGFTLDALEEWTSNRTSDSGPRAKAENIARAEIPLFMALRARR